VRSSSGDGNGWVVCSAGHRHWGRFGAAGILITDGAAVVLQHRAPWTHEGDTWALPGGARDSHEDALAAALREAAEETTLDASRLTPFGEWVDDHGGWSYTTVLARTTARMSLAPANAESVAVRWWLLDEVAGLALHRGFAAAWPHLRARLA
jgi:8-oxo-dGTP diphosphatase